MASPTNASEAVAVAPGVLRVSLPVPYRVGSVHVYLLVGEGGPLLFDTGVAGRKSYEVLRGALERASVHVEEIRGIVLSHHHADHCGATAQIVAASGAPVSVHREDAALLEGVFADPGAVAQDVRLLARFGAPADFVDSMATLLSLTFSTAVPSFSVTTRLEGGETLVVGDRSWEVVWTPGHSRGHIALFDPADRLLVCGDTLLGEITPNIGYHPALADTNPVAEYRATLGLLRDLGARRALPAHGEPIEDVRGRAEQVLGHQLERSESVLSEIRRGARVASDVSRSIFGDLEMFESWLALRETLAHLVDLRARGLVRQVDADGVVAFEPLG